MFHAKAQVGSTKIRVHNLLKYWPEASTYKFGEKPDVLIFQKIYANKDYKVPITFPAIKILDICDPDWLGGVPIKETLDAMDAVVCPTEPIKEYLSQLTDKPIRVIKDRFDLDEFPAKKIHRGPVKTVVWFGYQHNAVSLKLAVRAFESRGIGLKVVSDHDPFASRWASKPEQYESKYSFVKYTPDTAYREIQQADICVLPKMVRPVDRFKSENKTVIANLLGLPVVTNAGELDALMDSEARNRHIDTMYDKLKQDYDCRLSVKEYKELIDEVKQS